jgi:hypothetical protein
METHQTKWKIHIKPTGESPNPGKLLRSKNENEAVTQESVATGKGGF